MNYGLTVQYFQNPDSFYTGKWLLIDGPVAGWISRAYGNSCFGIYSEELEKITGSLAINITKNVYIAVAETSLIRGRSPTAIVCLPLSRS